MTESEINLRCAKFAGWKLIKDPSVMWLVKGEWWSGPEGQMSTEVRDYCNDPCAADELLRRLQRHYDIRQHLYPGGAGCEITAWESAAITGDAVEGTWIRALAEAVAKMETGNG